MRFLVLLLVAALSGCAMTASGDMASVGGGGGGSVLDPTATQGPPVATRHYVTPGQKIADVPGRMKSLVLLRKDSEKRNKRVCEAFLRLPSTVSAQGSGIPVDRITPTVWLVKSMPAENATCDALLQLYDFDAAAIYFAHLDRESANSPLLAAATNNELAYINLANASRGDIKALVPAWSKALIANNNKDIDLQNEVVRRVCSTSGVQPKNVTAEVLTIVDGANVGLWKAIQTGVTTLANIVPYGTQLLNATRGTCQQIKQMGVA